MRIDFTYKMHCLKALRLVFIALIMMGGAPLDGGAQTKEYANSQTNGKNGALILLGGGLGGYNSIDGTLGASTVANVEDAPRAVDQNETTLATMKARNVNLAVAGYSGEAWLQMNFPNSVSAHTTTYVKIDKPETKGLSLDLLETVGGLLGLLSEYIIITEVYDGSDQLSSGNIHSTIVEDGNGDVYLAVTPTQNYTGVRLKLRSQSNLLGLSIGGGLDMNVYEAFYYTDATDCGRPLYTYYEDSGLNVGLLEFQNRNLNNAIDSDEDTYSQLKQGALLGVNVAGSQSQVFNFVSSSSETATLNIKLLLGSGGVLNADLLGAAEVILYNGAEKVYQRSLQSSLLNNTDLLSLLQNGEPIIMTFAPGRAFDRAEVRLTSPVGVSLLGDALKIYDIERFDDAAGCKNPEIADLPDPTDGPFDVASCFSDLIDFENADFAQRAVDGNNETYATLYADAGNLLVSGPTAGFIEMGLGQVPANTTTYVRIGYDQDVLDALLGGSLGELLGDALNNLVLGNQYIQVQAIDSNDPDNPVLDQSSSNAFEGNAGGEVTIVQDKIGRYYLAITPDQDYDAIRITNHVTAVLPTGKKASLDVYNACFEIGTELCFPPNFTSYKGGGINLSVGNISKSGVTNPYRAISDNSSEYSEINLGVLGVAANVYQTIYFNKPSQPNDKVKIRLQVEPSSALSLDVLGAYKIKFYNGNDQVGSDYDLKNYALINNIDLLTLFGSGGTITLDFEPSGTFDRVDIGAESIVELNVDAEPLRVYSVKRYGDTCPLLIGESPFESPTCAVELIASENADDVQNLFDGDFDSFATLNSGAGFLLGSNQHEGFVELGYDHDVPAGITSYIRIDFEETILEKLVGGSLGNIVSGLLDGLILGDHFFEVDIKHDGNSVAFASSGDASVGGNNAIRVVRDKQGRYYIAVTPDQDYNSVRITDKTNSLLGLLAEPNTMNVYGMCYENSANKCLEAFATSFEYSGLNLSVNDLGGAGVTNPQYAINDNSTQGSEISNGTLAVGASTKQWIFFNTLSLANDVVDIEIDTESGVVDLDLLGGLEIIAYNGNDTIAVLNWQNGIVNGVNVLDLLSTGQRVKVPFSPGAEFDRISVGIKTLVGASVFPPLTLYSVTKRCKVGRLLITNPMIYQRVK